MHHTKIATFGSNVVAEEVLRLAVAIGLSPIGLPHPTVDEPWVAGLTAVDPNEPAVDVRIIWEPTDEPIAQRTIAVQTGPDRIEWLSRPDVIAVVHDVRAFHSLVSVGHPFIPLSQLAMALLRAALDSEISGQLDQDDLIHLGDAMMIQ